MTKLNKIPFYSRKYQKFFRTYEEYVKFDAYKKAEWAKEKFSTYKNKKYM